MRSSPLRSFPVALVALLAGAVGMGACSSITETNQTLQKYGGVNFVAKRTASGQGSATATVVAFESIGLQVPNSSLQQNDQCVYAAVDTLPQTARGDRSAGDAVAVVVGGNTRQLAYSTADLRYATPVGSPIVYSAGDIAQVNIPGNGSAFPAISGSVKLAEPLVLDTLTLPSNGQNLTITWNGTNDATAAIILQLKYPNPVSSTYANEQIYCALKDDGSVVLPGGLLNPFQVATTKRSLTIVRWRTNFVTANGANLHLTSSIDTTVVFP
ncbi:hypothetical protein [Gemmatimonas sp.]